MGALEDGRKQLLAVHDGFRESELSWQELLEDLKRQGLELPPKLEVGDGAMGFWAALRKVYPATGEQRCWLHKTANVLNKLPQSMQGKAKQALRDIYLAESRQTAEAALDRFKNLYEKKFPKAVECLEKDRKVLLAFYDFPAEHWGHLRTTNPIESTFATVRLRQRRTKGCGSREASLTMVFMLARQAERLSRDGHGLVLRLVRCDPYGDSFGILVNELVMACAPPGSLAIVSGFSNLGRSAWFAVTLMAIVSGFSSMNLGRSPSSECSFGAKDFSGIQSE